MVDHTVNTQTACNSLKAKKLGYLTTTLI